MRVLSVLCIFVIVINYLGIRGGVEGNSSTTLRFSLNGATGRTYREFINSLRAQLTVETQSSYGIPVLHQRVPDSQRFILIDLSNYHNETITIAIDVVSVSVVAYRVVYCSYFLRQDDPINVPIGTLFLDTTRRMLEFTGSYIDLQRAANLKREEIPLGASPLNNSITRLQNHESIAESLLIIIQMVSESARFRYIERQVGECIDRGDNFSPKSATVSLQDNWSVLSTEIQRALPGGLFTQTVELRDISNHLVQVDSIASPVIARISLLLYRCNSSTTSNIGGSNSLVEAQPSGLLIRMHVKDEDDDDMYKGGRHHTTGISGRDGLCGDVRDDICLLQDRTTRISGRDGLCVDVKDNRDADGTAIIMWPCHHQRNQQWTFGTDGTIRSMGKCMTSSGANVVIYNCESTVMPKDATKWALSADGTITNLRSGLVLTATGGQKTQLAIKSNSYNPVQGWRVGDDVEPTVAFIQGYNDLCMEANSNARDRVRMENCVLGKQQQQWALYGDGTIRVNSNHSLCVTSNGHSSMDNIIILECKAMGNQRWVFKTDGSILNPNAKLVMDVRESSTNTSSFHYQIVLYEPTGLPNQQWLPSF